MSKSPTPGRSVLYSTVVLFAALFLQATGASAQVRDRFCIFVCNMSGPAQRGMVDRAMTRTDNGFSVTGTVVTGSGRTFSFQRSVVRSPGSGVNITGSVTAPNGGTIGFMKSVTRTDNGLSISQTLTLPNGRTASRSLLLTRTGSGIQGTLSVMRPNGSGMTRTFSRSGPSQD